jgi:hypothetical protein
MVWEAGAQGNGCGLFYDGATQNFIFQGGDGTGAGSGNSAVELVWTGAALNTSYTVKISYSQSENKAVFRVNGSIVDSGGPGDGTTLNAISGKNTAMVNTEQDVFDDGVCDNNAGFQKDFHFRSFTDMATMSNVTGETGTSDVNVNNPPSASLVVTKI